MKNFSRLSAFLLLFSILTLLLSSNSFEVTWSATDKRFTTTLGFDVASAMAQTADKKIWFVWEKEVEAFRAIYCRTSSDFGATWSSELNLTQIPVPYQNTDPAIVQISNGNIWIAWSSDMPPPDFNMTASPNIITIPLGNSQTSNITVRSLNDFNEPVDLSVRTSIEGVFTSLNPTRVTPPLNGQINSTLTITVDVTATPGNYTLVVMGKSPSRTHSVSIDLQITTGLSAALSKPEALPTGPVVNYDIWYRTSSDSGASWSKEGQLTTDAADDLSPSILQASNGTIWLVWNSMRTGNYEIFYKTSSNAGVSWSVDRQLTFNASTDARPAVAQMADGRIWVAWYSNRFGQNQILYKIYNGLSWSSDMRLTNDARSDIAPVLLQTIDGTIWVFWSSTGLGPNDTSDVYYKQSINNGVTWSGSVQFTTDNLEDLWPAAMQASDTTIWVSWTSNRGDQPDGNFDIWYRISLAGDINGDGAVNSLDLTLMSNAFGSTPASPNWSASADINKDNLVGAGDLYILGKSFGAT